MAETWNELTGIIFPKARIDLEVGLETLFKDGKLKTAARTPADRKRIFKELWEAAEGDCPRFIEAVEMALEAGAGDRFILSVLQNPDQSPPTPVPKPKPETKTKAKTKSKKTDGVVPFRSVPEPSKDNGDDPIPTSGKFDTPPEIRPHHVEALNNRGITMLFALRSGIRSIADNEARALGFSTVLTRDQRSKGMQGLLFSYCDPKTREELGFRLKPDQQFTISNEPAKYISPKGDHTRLYYPHNTTQDKLDDPKCNIFLTEGEFKALALAEQVAPIASRKTCVIGLQGVNGGWHRDSVTITRPDGSKETKKHGHAHLNKELDDLPLKKRVVYIIFDSDVGTKKHAELFSKSPRSGALGAEYTLAQLLKARGADVRIVVIPHDPGRDKVGADDYIYAHGGHALLKLIYNNWVLKRNVEEILYREENNSLLIESAGDLVASAPSKPDFVVSGILPVGGTMMLSGPPGIGKSYLALGLAYSVTQGEPFLDIPTSKGNVLYVQSEIPRWSMSERINALQHVPKGLFIWTVQNFTFNLWEPDGFNKRRDTGMMGQLSNLARSIMDRGVKLLIIDPLAQFHTLDENSPVHMSHLFMVFRKVARTANCGVMVVHHHRKTGGRMTKYEGSDDMRGSIALSAEPDSVLSMYSYNAANDAVRLKLLFAKLRHSEPMKPMELRRASGDTLIWEGETWLDYGSKGDTEQAVLSVLAKYDEGLTANDIQQKVKKHISTVHRAVNKLVSNSEVIKKGTIFHINRYVDDDLLNESLNE